MLLNLEEKKDNRPRYRTPRNETAVKVYTVNHESKYLRVANVPALGNIRELIQVFAAFGDIEQYHLLDEENPDPYNDLYRIKFCDLPSARQAKRQLNKTPFLGQLLEVAYAPQYESVEDTKQKLDTRYSELQYRLDPNTRREIYQKPERPKFTVPDFIVPEKGSYLEELAPTEVAQPTPFENIPKTTDNSVLFLPVARKKRVVLSPNKKNTVPERYDYRETAPNPQPGKANTTTTTSISPSADLNDKAPQEISRTGKDSKHQDKRSSYSDMTPSMNAAVLKIRERMNEALLSKAKKKRKRPDSGTEEQKSKHQRTQEQKKEQT